jgi:hypothetical protein
MVTKDERAPVHDQIKLWTECATLPKCNRRDFGTRNRRASVRGAAILEAA